MPDGKFHRKSKTAFPRILLFFPPPHWTDGDFPATLAPFSYLHVPFCHRVCPYCIFYKHKPGNSSIGGFVAALVTETRLRLAECPGPPRTLYLGGGTPSMLAPQMLRRLFGRLAEWLDFPLLEEVTMEANPAAFGPVRARAAVPLLRDGGMFHLARRIWPRKGSRTRKAAGWL